MEKQGMKIEEFLTEAKKNFGAKILSGPMVMSPEITEKTGITQKEMDEYPKQVWLKNATKCPACGNLLFDLLGGTFQWGLTHGEGGCASCNRIQIRLYHFIGKKRFIYPAIIAF